MAPVAPVTLGTPERPAEKPNTALSNSTEKGNTRPGTPPVNLVDHGFMDSRAKLIDIAAFLDRLDRHGQADDFRVRALLRGIAELGTGDQPDRARRILEVFSDPSETPVDAATVQGAVGAFDPPAAHNPGGGKA
jgi:hypothetical protein